MNHYEKYEKVVQDMKIPQNRKIANPQNAQWFLQQGVAFNRDHPQILTAIFHAKHI